MITGLCIAFFSRCVGGDGVHIPLSADAAARTAVTVARGGSSWAGLKVWPQSAVMVPQHVSHCPQISHRSIAEVTSPPAGQVHVSGMGVFLRCGAAEAAPGLGTAGL